MSFYSKHILPRIIDLAMRNKETTRLRAECIPRARGAVLEIGIGSGRNLPFYSAEVQHIYGVDPSLELQRMARENHPAEPVKVDFFTQSAEEPIPLANASIDTAVITWTLCSIPDPAKALQQVKRVLRNDGRLIFVEHGHAPDSGVALWQDRLTPLWRRSGWLPPESQDRRTHHECRVSDRRAEDELSSRTSTHDLHISGMGGDRPDTCFSLTLRGRAGIKYSHSTSRGGSTR